jgi:pimeloyl-ACP methyl ester carboxylesterase
MRLDIAPELLPFEHRFVALDGARIHYLSEGTGETVLLLHGNPAWSFLYRKIIAGLKGDFHCVAPDFPGYGLSSAPPGYGYTPREHSAFLERFADAYPQRSARTSSSQRRTTSRRSRPTCPSSPTGLR